MSRAEATAIAKGPLAVSTAASVWLDLLTLIPPATYTINQATIQLHDSYSLSITGTVPALTPPVQVYI